MAVIDPTPNEASPTGPPRAARWALGAGAGAALVLGVAAAVWLGMRHRGEPARCPPGLELRGPRCCGEGQGIEGKRCSGKPSACASGMTIDPAGCVAKPRRVRVPAGVLRVGPTDWESQGVVAARESHVESFSIDSHEVTVNRWQACVAEGGCERLDRRDEVEPGVPVRGVTPEQAERFCSLAGGRLPTSDEWLRAATGDAARRFPWGETGLVCRRAAFGLADGPCAAGAIGPDLAGARPDGATPDGIVDLAGNVAEWTREPEGDHVARGGSFRSRVAAAVKSSAMTPADESAPEVGFRCVYDSTP